MPARPRLVRRNGRTCWLFDTGRLLPVIHGGDGSGGEGGGEGGADGGGGGGDELGEGGKKALEAERALRASADKERKAAEKRAKELETELQKFRDADKSELERAVEQARREAADTVTSEMTAKFNRRLLEAEVRSTAAGKLSDPADAVRLLDLDEFAVGDDGVIDATPITKAIEKLLKDKPYLAAGELRRNGGGADGGRRGTGATESDKPADVFGRLVSDQLRS